MSVDVLNSSISAARADGCITAEEAKTFTSPQVLGAYTVKDEFQVVTNQAADTKGANTVQKPGEKKSLTKRGVNIGAIVSGTIGVVGAVAIIGFAVALPIASGGAFLAIALPLATIFWCYANTAISGFGLASREE